MPYNQPDPHDPTLLVGVELPADAAPLPDTAAVLAEEYARLGYDEDRLMALFKNPHYAGMHQLYCALGETKIRAIVREQVDFWGRIRFRDVDPLPAGRKTGGQP